MRGIPLLSGALCGLLLATGLVGLPSATLANSTLKPVMQEPSRDDGQPDAVIITDDPVAGQEQTLQAASAAADFTDVNIPSRADIVVHKVTIALVAPQGTTPSFAAEEARRSLDLVDRFYDRETGGAIRFELERLIDWQVIDEPIGCSNTGGLHDWISRKLGWQPGPARHLVAMVPPGDPCPVWANGEQPGDPDDGGRTFQGGPDAILLAHELGHNLSLFHAASVHCNSSSSWDVASGTSCPREEYGNLTDVMGDSWLFTPLSAPTLAQLGILAATRQPVCGAPRTAVIDSLGAGPGAPRALTWTDPQDSSIRYWAQYNDKADPRADGGTYTSPWQTARTISGVQLLRTAGGGSELLQRPDDFSIGNEFAQTGETVTLNNGMSLRVESIDETTRTATITVTVPCTEFVGDISRHAVASASYTSEWSTIAAAVDVDPGSAWSSWPRVGEQWLSLRWPEAVTVDAASVRFESDAADGDQRGLIPPRTWRVEYFDNTTQAWAPVPGATSGGRERDTMNTVVFTPTTTSEVRVVFEAWGDWEYGGSTGVGQLAVNGVAPAASLVAHGNASSVPTSTSSDLKMGVEVRDAQGRALSGRPVLFTLDGPAAFGDGKKTATVASDPNGIAALPLIRTESTTGTISASASISGLRPVTFPKTTVAVAPSISATAAARKLSGKVVLTVTAKNTGTSSAELTILTPYGSSRIASVAPGVSVSRVFATGRSTIPAGAVQVTSRANGLEVVTTANYRAL